MDLRTYKRVIWQSETPRQIERRILTRNTRALIQHAEKYDGKINSEERLSILYNGLGESIVENRLFWSMLKIDLASKEDSLTTGLRAQLLSIALWVERETDSVMNGMPGVLNLIAVNQNIIAGLAGVHPEIEG